MPPRPPDARGPRDFPDRPAGPPEVRALPAAQALVAEKIRVLKLLRTLDRIGIDPSDSPALRTALVALAEGDQLLTTMLELVDHDPGTAEGVHAAFESMRPVCESVRGDVLDALAPRDQAAARRAAGEVAATETEIWMQVDAVRRDLPVESPGRRRPSTRAQAREAGEAVLARGSPPPLAGSAQVRDHEKRALPSEDAALETWLQHVPLGWLHTMARLHEVPMPRKQTSATEVELCVALARRLLDPAWLRTYLAERIGASERELLVTLLHLGETPPVRSLATLKEALAVPWDWEADLPATTGGRLRAAGFVFVGMRGKQKVAAVPVALRPLLRDALEAADPRVAGIPERARRLAAAQESRHASHASPELTRWKDHEAAILKRFRDWLMNERPGPEAWRAFFGDGPQEARTSVEGAAFLEFLLLDWRDPPHGPSLAERSLPLQPFRNPERQGLASAMCAAPQGLYRVEGIRRGDDVTFVPLFAGSPFVLTDRALSLTVEEGLLFGLRSYRAGPFTFARFLGEPLWADAERRLLRHLRRAHDAYVATHGSTSESEFVLRQPAAIAQALRACAPEG